MQPTPPTPPLATPETVDALETDLTPEPVETTLDITPQTYYQAIGWLRGKLVKGEERFLIEIKDKVFPLYLPRKVFAVANNSLEQMIWLKCYPQSKGEGLSFKVIWMGAEQSEKGEAGIFVLRGVWQFIPQSRRPVFSIYRNELKDYETRPSNQHLPLIWADQPPYRFRKDSEERPKFYQITARLIPQRGCFGFVSQIAEPIEQTPRRVKKPPLNAPPDSDKGDGKKADALKEEVQGKSKYPKPTKEPKVSPSSEVLSELEQVNLTGEAEAVAIPPMEKEAQVVTTEAIAATEPTQAEVPAATVTETITEPEFPNSTEEETVSTVETPAEVPVEVTAKTKKATTTKRKTKEVDGTTPEGEPKAKAKRTTKKTTKTE
ncbi:MAG: hypothetical protein ACRC6M_03440 [Microcystaceae cyanobacterium]